MPTMFQRMTIWAQHFQVAQFVVATVSIFMVHTKNLRHRIVTAPFTCSKHISFDHCFAHRRKIWPPHIFSSFVNTGFGTIFSFCRRRIQKNNATMNAVVVHSAFFVHGFVVALRAAIFCLVGAARNMLKIGSAFGACRIHLRSSRKSHTLSTTILRSVFSVLWHCKTGLAVFANNRVSSSGAFCATH